MRLRLCRLSSFGLLCGLCLCLLCLGLLWFWLRLCLSTSEFALWAPHDGLDGVSFEHLLLLKVATALSDDFCLDPGLRWKRLLLRAWADKTCFRYNFQDVHSICGQSQVSVLDVCENYRICSPIPA